MRCRYCNTELKQGAKFCKNCGKEVLEFDSCISCGQQIKVGASFCPYCGASQKEGVQPIHKLEQSIEASNSENMATQQHEDIPIVATPPNTVDTEQPQVTPEEQPTFIEEKEQAKTWRWVVCAVLVIGLAGGLYFFLSGKTNSSKSNETEMVIADSSEMDEIIAKRITDIYNDVFSGNGCADADSKYCSKGYLSLAKEFEEAYANSNIDEIMGLDYDHWTLTNEEAVNPSMRIISISKQSDKDVIAKVHISYGQVENSGGDVSLRLIFENGNWFIDDFIHGDYSEKEGFQEDIKQLKELRNNNKRICESYIKKLKEHARGELMPCDYFLFDITKDGIPELWIESASKEEGYELTIYTHDLKKILQRGTLPSAFYKGEDYILQVRARMGYAAWIKLYYDGNKIQEKTIFSEEGVDDYTEPKEKKIDFIPYNNITPIKNAFNQ